MSTGVVDAERYETRRNSNLIGSAAIDGCRVLDTSDHSEIISSTHGRGPSRRQELEVLHGWLSKPYRC